MKHRYRKGLSLYIFLFIGIFCVSSLPSANYSQVNFSFLAPQHRTGSVSFLAQFIGRTLNILPPGLDSRYSLILFEIERQLKVFFHTNGVDRQAVIHISKQSDHSFIIETKDRKQYTFAFVVPDKNGEQVVSELSIKQKTAKVVPDDLGMFKFEGVIYSTTVSQPVTARALITKLKKNEEGIVFADVEGEKFPLQKIGSNGQGDIYEAKLLFPKPGVFRYKIVAGDNLDTVNGEIINRHDSHEVLVKVDPDWVQGMNIYDSIHPKIVRAPADLSLNRSGNVSDIKWMIDEKIAEGFTVFKFLPIIESISKSPYAPFSLFMMSADYIDWQLVDDKGETIQEKCESFLKGYLGKKESELRNRELAFKVFSEREFVKEYAVLKAVKDMLHQAWGESFELRRQKYAYHNTLDRVRELVERGDFAQEKLEALQRVSLEDFKHTVESKDYRDMLKGIYEEYDLELNFKAMLDMLVREGKLNEEGRQGIYDKGLAKLFENEEFKRLYFRNLYIAFVSREQVKNLVNYIHQKGGRVLLDFPFYRGYYSADTFFHSEYFKKDKEGKIVAPFWGIPGEPGYQYWGDLATPDFEKLKQEGYEPYFAPFFYWIEEIGIDGFRWDAAHYAPLEAWGYLAQRLNGKDLYVLAEQLGGPYEEACPGKIYGFHVYENLEFKDKQPENFERFLAWVCQGRNYPMHSSHDSAKIADFKNQNQQYGCFDRDDPREMQVKAVLAEFALGAPIFYIQMGDEFLSEERIHKPGKDSEWNSRSPWDPEAVSQGDIRAYIRRLNEMRAQHPALKELYNFKILENNKKAEGVSSFMRESASRESSLLVLNNLSGKEHEGEVVVPSADFLVAEGQKLFLTDLLSGERISLTAGENLFPERQVMKFTLKPGQTLVYDLSSMKRERDKFIEKWLAEHVYVQVFQGEILAKLESLNLFKRTGSDFKKLLTLISKYPYAEIIAAPEALIAEISQEDIQKYTREWTFRDKNKETLLTENQWLVVSAGESNHTYLNLIDEEKQTIAGSIKIGSEYFSVISPRKSGDYRLTFNWSGREEGRNYQLKVLPVYRETQEERLAAKDFPSLVISKEDLDKLSDEAEVTIGNGKGAICRIPLKGIVQGRGYISKYDAELQANVNPELPEDRRVTVKGSHTSVQIDGKWYDLNEDIFYKFERYPFPSWQYRIGEGEDKVIIERTVSMVRGENTVVSHYKVIQAPQDKKIRLHVRPHLTTRSFHENTKAGKGLEGYWNSRVWDIDLGEEVKGIGFDPVQGVWGNNYKGTYVLANRGNFARAVEWYYSSWHPKETNRGQEDKEDVFSPGYFEADLANGESLDICASAPNLEEQLPHNRTAFYRSENLKELREAEINRMKKLFDTIPLSEAKKDAFFKKLLLALDIFVVDRETHKTVIAGYPWFTDWGRDTFIAALGMLKGGMISEVKDIILQFGKFEENGTLPNIIHGETAGNRDTVDAPLWYFEVIKQYMAIAGNDNILAEKVDEVRTVQDILRSIIDNYKRGTPNGIYMDMATGLVFAPSHFTWMDTNYPAGTPRQGYPVEIQALWYNALKFFAGIEKKSTEREKIEELAVQVKQNFKRLFWNAEGEYLYDNLKAEIGVSAVDAGRDTAFRSNQSIPVLYGLLEPEKSRKVIRQMYQKLVVPAGIRSLSEGSFSLDGYGYKGNYEGDEDTSRKLAYHNGTAWTFPLAQFMLAYAAAFDYSRKAIEEMLTIFESVKEHLREAGIGNISEVMDGDAPHTNRGCDEQAWGATEFLRAYAVLRYEYLESYNYISGEFKKLIKSGERTFNDWKEILAKINRKAKVTYNISILLADGKPLVLKVPYSGNETQDAAILSEYIRLCLKSSRKALKFLDIAVSLNSRYHAGMTKAVQSVLNKNISLTDTLGYAGKISACSA